jgi:hypothetical protein
MTMRALLFGLLVVAMVVAGCGDDDDSNSAEQLNGTWESDTRLTTFESDGEVDPPAVELRGGLLMDHRVRL